MHFYNMAFSRLVTQFVLNGTEKQCPGRILQRQYLNIDLFKMLTFWTTLILLIISFFVVLILKYSLKFME